MTPAEELEMLELEAEAARSKSRGKRLSQTEVPQEQKTVLAPDQLSQGAQDFRPGGPSSEPVGYAAQFYGGAKHALQKSIQGLAGLVGAEAVSPRTLSQGKAFVDETGPASTAGGVTADVGATLYPATKIASGAQKLVKAMEAIKGLRGGAGAAGLATEMAGNAGLNAALAPEDRGMAALIGGGGTLGGRVAGSLAEGPLRSLVSPEARVLMDRGIFLTPGQAVTGKDMGKVARFLRNSEDAISSYPVVGAIQKSGQVRSITEHNISEYNQALAPVGAKITKSGRDGAKAAEQAVSDVYDEVLPKYFAPSAKVDQVLDNFIDDAIAHNSQFSGNSKLAKQYQNPTIGAPWMPNSGVPVPPSSQIQTLFNNMDEQEVTKFIERRLRPLTANGDIPGPIAKDIDSQLGELTRTAIKKQNEPLAEAWGLLRDKLRGTYFSRDPAVLSKLDGANTAWAKLRPMIDASERTLSGHVTPRQLQVSTDRTGQKATETGIAARDVLPSTVPDSGTAERLLFNKWLSPAAAASAYGTTSTVAGALSPALGAAAVLGAAYTKPGMKFLTEGSVPALEKMLNALRSGPPTKVNAQGIRDITRLLAARAGTATGNAMNEGE